TRPPPPPRRIRRAARAARAPPPRWRAPLPSAPGRPRSRAAGRGDPAAGPPAPRRSRLRPASSQVEPGDQGHVIALPPERARAVAKATSGLEGLPGHAAAGEEVVEVHAQVHEAGGGEVARVAVDLAEVLLHADEAAVLGQVAVHRGGGRRVEV